MYTYSWTKGGAALEDCIILKSLVVADLHVFFLSERTGRLVPGGNYVLMKATASTS